jgi:hypothetical protein
VKRTALTLCAAASLCACLATLACSVRSYAIADDLYWTRRSAPTHAVIDRIINLHSSRGGIKLSVRWASASQGDYLPVKPRATFESRPRRARDFPEWPDSPDYRVDWLRFAIVAAPTRQVILLPYWPISLLLLLLPILWLRKAIRLARLRRIARRGICPDCHYDLRASTDRCPECGRTVGLGSLAVGRPEGTALLVMLVSPFATVALMAMLGVFSRPAAPAAPSGLAADAVIAADRYGRLRTHVHLTWSDHSDNETAFTVERTPVGGSWELVICDPNQTELMDGGVLRDEVYDYRVYATNDFGSSGPSNVLRVTADPELRSPP